MTFENMEFSGPLITVNIGVSAPVQKIMIELNIQVPAPVSCTALIDTGASSTVLRTGIPALLGLRPRGAVPISTPSCHECLCNTFDISLYFPSHQLGMDQMIAI